MSTKVTELLCDSDLSLLQALRIIDSNAMGTAFVVDSDNRLKGVLTDGDIRRALLNNKDLDVKVADIVSRNFVFAYIDDDIQNLMNKVDERVTIIPLVNKGMEVVDFVHINQKVYFPVAMPKFSGNEFKYLNDAFLSTWISSTGKYISELEHNFAKFSDCEFGVAVSNGTVALQLSLSALGIGAGDEVIIPDLTFAATVNAVIHSGATPVIVDIDRESWCIDPEGIERAITPRTKAIIPVHIYGQPCDMHAISEIAKTHDIHVIEDCAEAHGAKFDGTKVGAFGDIGCFSFFANKVITTGEGGICVTNDRALYERMRLLRDHGMSKERRYWHEAPGFNFRMTNLQAAIGVAQLERIESILDYRRKFEDAYRDVFKDSSILTFQNRGLAKRGRITWLTSALVAPGLDRDDFLERLKTEGLDSRPFFYPLSAMPVYAPFCPNPTVVAPEVAARGVNLPTYDNPESLDKLLPLLRQISASHSSDLGASRAIPTPQVSSL